MERFAGRGLSQAALIHRQLAQVSVETKPMREWAFQRNGQRFYLQTLTDLRLEPRWQPDFADAALMKEDYFGRIMIAAKNNEKNIPSGELHDLVLGSGPESLKSLCEWPRPYYPGPLEGKENTQTSAPDDIADAIKTQLAAEEVGPSSFIALVNSAQLFRVETDQASLAAKALKLGSYRLANVEDRAQLLAVLNGLATVAAVVRSPALADELRILARRYRRDPQYALSIEESMKICLVASASREDIKAWRDFAGDWLTELAFDDFEDNDAAILEGIIHYLCHAVPELWVSCGRADAALKAFDAR